MRTDLTARAGTGAFFSWPAFFRCPNLGGGSPSSIAAEGGPGEPIFSLRDSELLRRTNEDQRRRAELRSLHRPRALGALGFRHTQTLATLKRTVFRSQS